MKARHLTPGTTVHHDGAWHTVTDVQHWTGRGDWFPDQVLITLAGRRQCVVLPADRGVITATEEHP